MAMSSLDGWYRGGRPVEYCPCRIHRLHLCRGVRPLIECPRYDSKQFDHEVSVVLELWWMRSTPSSLLLSGLLRPRVVASDRVLSMRQIEQKRVLMRNWIAWNITILTIKLHTYAKQNCSKQNSFWHLNVCKQKSYTYTKLNCLN